MASSPRHWPLYPRRTAPLPNALGNGWFGHGANKNVLVPVGSQTAVHNFSHFTITSLSWFIQYMSICFWVAVFPPVTYTQHTLHLIFSIVCIFQHTLSFLPLSYAIYSVTCQMLLLYCLWLIPGGRKWLLTILEWYDQKKVKRIWNVGWNNGHALGIL